MSGKSVRAWFAGAPIRRANQEKVAAELGLTRRFLFPEDEFDPDDPISEIVRVFPRRADSGIDLWWEQFTNVVDRLDLLGYATLFLTDTYLDLVELLVDKANQGCRIRLILADPASETLRQRDAEEGLDGGLIARVKTALKDYAPLAECAEIRLQRAPMYNSTFRFDDDMLVTTHLFAVPGREAPLFHLTRLGEKGLFARYAANFERIWEASSFEFMAA